MENVLPHGSGDPEDAQYAKVMKRLCDAEGCPIRTAYDNPLLDTREYEDEFLDDHSESMSANLIAQHLFHRLIRKDTGMFFWTTLLTSRRMRQQLIKQMHLL
jgi:hypothetical protein